MIEFHLVSHNLRHAYRKSVRVALKLQLVLDLSGELKLTLRLARVSPPYTKFSHKPRVHSCSFAAAVGIKNGAQCGFCSITFTLEWPAKICCAPSCHLAKHYFRQAFSAVSTMQWMRKPLWPNFFIKQENFQIFRVPSAAEIIVDSFILF